MAQSGSPFPVFPGKRVRIYTGDLADESTPDQGSPSSVTTVPQLISTESSLSASKRQRVSTNPTIPRIGLDLLTAEERARRDIMILRRIHKTLSTSGRICYTGEYVKTHINVTTPYPDSLAVIDMPVNAELYIEQVLTGLVDYIIDKDADIEDAGMIVRDICENGLGPFHIPTPRFNTKYRTTAESQEVLKDMMESATEKEHLNVLQCYQYAEKWLEIAHRAYTELIATLTSFSPIEGRTYFKPLSAEEKAAKIELAQAQRREDAEGEGGDSMEIDNLVVSQPEPESESQSTKAPANPRLFQFDVDMNDMIDPARSGVTGLRDAFRLGNRLTHLEYHNHSVWIVDTSDHISHVAKKSQARSNPVLRGAKVKMKAFRLLDERATLRGLQSRIRHGRPLARSFFTNSRASAFQQTPSPIPAPFLQYMSKPLRSPLLRRLQLKRFNSQKPNYNPTPHLGSPQESLSLSQRMRKLSREYGWSALGMYLLLSALDFPFCFVAVRMLGTDRIGHWEHVVMDWFWKVVPWPAGEKIGRDHVELYGEPENKSKGEAVAIGEAGWGVEEAEKMNKSDQASKLMDHEGQHRLREPLWLMNDAGIWTQLALAYAVHKSFIFIRVPLTVAVTPKVVKVLRGWGWNIGKRKPKVGKGSKD
ncbi:MAG: hypothetical protein M1827_005348 [Pycnora praestabilis]|nr:MAG: hypothetical protein M1827_005348 [Pycnora praestabilis]